MPLKEEWVEADMFTFHKGIKIYYTYVDNQFNHGPHAYIFSTDSSDNEKSQFDIRELDVASRSHLQDHPKYVDYTTMSEAEVSGLEEAWKYYYKCVPEIARHMIHEAIEAGLIDQQGPIHPELWSDPEPFEFPSMKYLYLGYPDL